MWEKHLWLRETQCNVSVVVCGISLPLHWPLANLQAGEGSAVQNITCSHQARLSIYLDKNPQLFHGFSVRICFVLLENMLFATG